MKKLNDNISQEIKASGNVCDAFSGFMAGWGVGAILVGAATGGIAIVLGAAVISQYCSSKNSI